MITPQLETERMLLRPAKVEDAQIIYNNWTSDPDVAKFMRWNVHGSVDETIDYLTRTEINVADENSYDWLFVLKATNEPIGSGGVFHSKKHDMFELGYGIMKACWGKGFATEAATAIMKFAIEELGKTQLYACVANENPASGSVLKKLGFVYKGDGEYSSFDGKRVFQCKEYFYQM